MVGDEESGLKLISEVCEGQMASRTPVTPILMAWAAHLIGRSYRDYQLDYRVLVEAQTRSAEILGIDQVSAISDPWREADAMGAKLIYPTEGVGQPQGHLLEGDLDPSCVPKLDPHLGERTLDRLKGVEGLAGASRGRWSVLGWVEGVFAELCDLRNLQDVMLDLYDEPDSAKAVMDRILENEIAFALAQIQAGADMIGVGDAAASLLSPHQFREFVQPYEIKLIEAIHGAGAKVKLHICGNTTKLLHLMVETGADIIDVDWMVDLEAALPAADGRCVIAGNLDPVRIIRNGTPDLVRREVDTVLETAAGRPFILQPGCEVPPGTPIENLLVFCPGNV